MGLRNRTQQPFWRTTPTRSSEPKVLYQHGIECVGKQDGKGMIAVGWALCQVAALHEHQASDFLTDGYRIWKEGAGFDRAEGAAFLADLFGALCSLTPPQVPSDIWSAEPESVLPASVYYGTRCWSGTELLDVTPDPATRTQYEPLVFRAVSEAPYDFVPVNSIDFAKSYAARNGQPEPWVIVLPSPRERVLAGSAPASGRSSAGAGSAAPPSVDAPPQVADYPKVEEYPQVEDYPKVSRSPKPSPRPTPGPAAPAGTSPTESSAPPESSAPTESSAPSRPQPSPGPRPKPSPGPAAPAATTRPSPAPAVAAAAPAASPTEPAEPAAPQAERDSVGELRDRLLGWLREEYPEVHEEENGWLTVPNVGPTAVQLEADHVDGHLKVDIFAPLVVDVPVTADLLRFVALEGGRFHFGAMTLDAGDDGEDERGLLQFSCPLLADHLERADLLTVVALVASTARERPEQLRESFGGQLYRELLDA